jgi:HAMP domain-containing protein
VNWEDAMWAELDELDPLQQHVACGEWITIMQQTLVPELSVRRRVKLLEACEKAGWDYWQVAESIGSRRATVERLVNEARAHLRDREVHRDAA